MTDWKDIDGATFTDNQAVFLRLKSGERMVAYFRDCAWLREEEPDVLDCFERFYPGSGRDIEMSEVFAWREPTQAELDSESMEQSDE